MMMGSTKFDIEKFTRNNDFGLWRVKMRALLVQQGIVEALQGPTVLPTEMPEKERNNILEKAYSTIILSLGDKALREVSRETTAQALWTKLELLYMTKSLANRLFLKQRLYSFKMHEEKSISEQIDEFNKIIDDLENIDVKMEDEDKALLLLNSIPNSYDHFKDAMLYGRENSGDGLTVRGRSDRRDSRNNQNRSRSKQTKKSGNQSSKGPFKCYHCHKEGHFKKNCPNQKNKYQERAKDSGEVSVVSVGYDSTEALVITESESRKEWILDSCCSFHMCPHKYWFETLQLVSGGTVLLGDNKACRVVGSGTTRIRMFDGAERILQHVRCPSIAIGMKTLLEMWYGKPANFNNLKVFGCLACAHIRKDKLEARALRCIFIGYSHGTKDYKLWCMEPGQHKCIISRDVVFDESKMANLHSYATKNNTTKDGIPIEVELQQQQTLTDQGKEVNDQHGELDVKTTFLYGEFEETIYMDHPDGSKEEVQKIKGMLNLEFDMKDLRLSNSQAPESEDEKTYMENVPYTSGVGSIMYGMVCSRPDLAYDVSIISRQENEREIVVGYVDSDYAGSIDTRKSLTGFIFTIFGTAGMVEELGIQQKVVTVFCDNLSIIHLTRNQVFHERSKHIDVKLHFVRDVITKGSITVNKIPTEENPADMLTKALPATKFRHCLDLVNSTEKWLRLLGAKTNSVVNVLTLTVGDENRSTWKGLWL
ncbi:Detected protein of unknown function [Hibiscus syriacus]|uniref:CCHC-type domain-containing protein n=1 Tax=Hibiscus syriacus TaxID=106335 RepID=A0A6A2X9R2_HIBSY|nr:Detected protein of unknown function [Hibiscus syriacus]